MDIAAEVRGAICASRPRRHGCCIVLNPLIPGLHRHGVRLLPAIEATVESAALCTDIRKSDLRANLAEVFTLYFQLAQDHEWDYASFTISLSDDLFHHALCGIRAVWATNNDERRTVMSEPLFKLLGERLPAGHSLLVTLNRLVKIGQLSFDPSHPGKRAPMRQSFRPSLKPAARDAPSSIDEC